jgi:hypothetical protein
MWLSQIPLHVAFGLRDVGEHHLIVDPVSKKMGPFTPENRNKCLEVPFFFNRAEFYDKSGQRKYNYIKVKLKVYLSGYTTVYESNRLIEVPERKSNVIPFPKRP